MKMFLILPVLKNRSLHGSSQGFDNKGNKSSCEFQLRQKYSPRRTSQAFQFWVTSGVTCEALEDHA